MNNNDTGTTIQVVNVYPKKYKGEILYSDIEGTQKLLSYVKGVVHVGDEIVIKKDKHLVIEKIQKIVDYEQSDGSGIFEYVDYAGNDSVTIYVKDTGIQIPEFKKYQIIRRNLSDEEIEINEGATKQKELDENSATIGCTTCGAPMKPNQYEGRYECPYCGNTIPFENNIDKLIKIEHMEYKTDNGFISIKHLNESKLDKSLEWSVLDAIDNKTSISSMFKKHDGVNHFSEELRINIVCPSCGGEVSGKEHQNTFECIYCGNKILVEDSLKRGTYKKRNILGRIAQKNVPKQAIPFEVSEEKALRYAIEYIRSNKKLRNISGLEKHVKEWLFPFFLPVTVMDASFIWKEKRFFNKNTYYEEIRNYICPETEFLYKYQIDRLEPWNFDKIGPFDAALMDENAYIIGSDYNYSFMWFAPRLVDNRIREEHKKITGTDSVNMSLAKRHIKEQRNGIILIPVYNTELYEIDNQYISIAVNGQTGKVVVQVQEDSSLAEMAIEYESELRHWEDNPEECTRIEGPYLVEKTKDKDMAKIVDTIG